MYFTNTTPLTSNKGCKKYKSSIYVTTKMPKLSNTLATERVYDSAKVVHVHDLKSSNDLKHVETT